MPFSRTVRAIWQWEALLLVPLVISLCLPQAVKWLLLFIMTDILKIN